MWGHRANKRKKSTNAVSCVAAMDIIFLIDFTGSMGPSIENVKSAITSLVATIEEESLNDYRLSLILFDEQPTPYSANIYINKPIYQALPSDQKIINGTVVITVLNKFAQNNYAECMQILNKMNTPDFPLGNGMNAPEPSDYALKMVLNNNIAGTFRTGVNKSIVIFTDAPPGGLNDSYRPEDDFVEMMSLANICKTNGITLSVCDISYQDPDKVFSISSAVTGGIYQGGNSVQVLRDLIINTCDNIATILPVVVTNAATGITTSGFTANGNVTSQGSSAITERGFLYSTSDINLIEGSAGVTKVTSGSGLGSFSYNISASLSGGQTFYFRAYCKNSNNIAYGDKLRASTTAVTTPTVLLNSMAIANGVLQMSGTISSDGGVNLTERGFVYSNSPDPFIGGTGVTKVVVPGLFTNYTSNVNVTNGTFYVKAYAINSAGTSYSAVRTNAASNRYNLTVNFFRAAGGSLTININGTDTIYTSSVNTTLLVPKDVSIGFTLVANGAGSVNTVRRMTIYGPSSTLYDVTDTQNLLYNDTMTSDLTITAELNGSTG